MTGPAGAGAAPGSAKGRMYTSFLPDCCDLYAIQRPSGEIRPKASLVGVATVGVMSPPCTGRATMSSPAPARVRMRNRPSFVQSVTTLPPPPASLISLASEDPPASFTYTPAPDAYAIWLPSGDQ